MKSAAGKRPADEAHGPGKEAIKPQQLCLGEPRKEGAQGHAALPAEVGTTLIQKIMPVTTPNLKYEQNSFKSCCTRQIEIDELICFLSFGVPR